MPKVGRRTRCAICLLLVILLPASLWAGEVSSTHPAAQPDTDRQTMMESVNPCLSRSAVGHGDAPAWTSRMTLYNPLTPDLARTRGEIWRRAQDATYAGGSGTALHSYQPTYPEMFFTSFKILAAAELALLGDRRGQEEMDHRVPVVGRGEVLIFADPVDAEIARIGMGKIQTTDRTTGMHGVIFRQRDAGFRFRIQQIKQDTFLGMIRDGRIAHCGPDTAVLFRNQILIAQVFLLAKSPLVPHFLVQVLGEGLGYAIPDSLDQDGRVVVLILLVPAGNVLNFLAGGDREPTHVINATG